MRTFVVVSHTAPLTGDFSLNDLPGGAGRLDVLCRAVTEAFLVSHGIRKDVTLHLVIQDQLILTLRGERLRHLNPDERSTAALLREALRLAQEIPPSAARESTPGILVHRGSLGSLLQQLSTMAAVFVLDENGVSIRHAALPPNPAFVLSDHKDFTPTELELLAPFPKVCVGPRVLQGHQCITLVHNELDWRAAGWKAGGN